MLRKALTTLLVAGLALAAAVADAADAGKIVTLEGTVEIGHGGAFAKAGVESVVETGDTIRTGTPGRARVLFIDDSVLNIADGSTLVVDETVFDPNKGSATTLLHLLGGKVRALVSDYYSGAQASYKIETTTAVAGVRGTEFVVAYNTKNQLSEVLGLGGTVEVHSPRDLKNHGVLVHDHQLTEVAKGKFPTPPRQITSDDDDYRRLMQGLSLPGAGDPESLILNDPTIGGKEVPLTDTPEGNGPITAGGLPTGPAGENPGGTFGPGAPDPDLPPDVPAKTGGDVLGQPQPVLNATGIDVHF